MPEEQQVNSAGQVIQKQATIFNQQQVAYVTLGTSPTERCANCAFFRDTGYDGIEYQHCHLVEAWPEPILPTGYCNEWRAKPEAPPELADTVAEAVGEAVESAVEAVIDAMPVSVELSEDGKRSVFVTPADGAMAQLQKRLRTNPLKPGVHVLKDSAGQRWLYMVTSNGYKDRDKEHVATKSLEAYVKSCFTGDDTAFVGQNDHYFWHTPELGSMSDLMHADVWSGFLVEFWREKPGDPIAKAFYNFMEDHPEIEWGASHGFDGLLKQDVFTHIHKFESSSLPLEAASNLLTLSEVLPMVEKSKRDNLLNQLFKEQFGIEDAAALLKQGPEKLRQELAAHGIEAKALGEGSDALKEARSQAVKNTAELMVSLVETQDAFDRRVEAMEKTQADTINGLQAQVKAYEQEVKDLRAIVNAGPRRPSQDGSTEATQELVDKSKSALPADEANEFESRWGVPMKKGDYPNGHG